MVAAIQSGVKELSSQVRHEGGRETVLDELRKLFAKAKLPSSPALASRILALADDPDATLDQFAKVIQVDGALAARLLKMANSACMALVTPATTIQRAVMVLGLGRVRTAALGFQLVGHLNKLGGKKFDIKAYWQQSVLRGCVGREIANVVAPGLAEEAFLNVWRTAEVLTHAVSEALKPHGLTLTQYNALRILRGAGSQVPPHPDQFRSRSTRWRS